MAITVGYKRSNNFQNTDNMESKFKIGDKVKGVGKNSDLIGIVCDISHSDDWISYYGRSYCREHYKIVIKSLSTNNIISWFHEGCFVLSD